MSNNYGLTLGLLALFIPVLLPACSAQRVQRRAKALDAQTAQAEPEQVQPQQEQPAQDEPGCATQTPCLGDQLPDSASFEAGEPEDYDWQDSGLGIFDRLEGEGEQVQDGDEVILAYTAYLLSGCAFDSTLLREPITIPLAGMIPGMREGLIGMRVGGQRRLYIPAELAYGDKGAGNVIGPDEVLVFEVELLEVP